MNEKKYGVVKINCLLTCTLYNEQQENEKKKKHENKTKSHCNFLSQFISFRPAYQFFIVKIFLHRNFL